MRTLIQMFVLLMCSTRLMAAVSFTVSPISISNSSPGSLFLKITGLTNEENVVVERILDVNGDGKNGTGEPIVEHLELKDGYVPMAYPLRNPFIPGDEEGKVGELDFHLPCADGGEFTKIAGKYRFRLSSVTGRFPSIEKAFTVTQPALSQSVTGRVFNVTKPLTNGIVALFTTNREFVSGVVADSKGNYRIYALPGTYRIAAMASQGLNRNQIGIEELVVITNKHVTRLYLTNATAARSISGRVQDKSSGKGLAGIQLQFMSQNDEKTLALTDLNGFYTAGVSLGEWNISFSEANLKRRGYLQVKPPVTANTTISNTVLDFNISQALTLMQGVLTNSVGQPIPGVTIVATNGDDPTVLTSGITGTNGEFLLEMGAGESWFCNPDFDSLAKAGYIPPLSGQFSLPPYYLRTFNISAAKIESHFQGTVVDQRGMPVPGVTVGGYSMLGFITSGVTDANGRFELGASGDDFWTFLVDDDSASAKGFLTPYSTDVPTSVGTTNSADFVVQRMTGSVKGRICDTNGLGVAGACISASAIVNGINYGFLRYSDSNGNYEFGVCDGAWYIELLFPEALGYYTPTPVDITVANDTNTVNFTLEAVKPFVFTTTVLPDAQMNVPYNVQLPVEGGVPPYFCEVISGDLPVGISMFYDGMFSGTATRPGKSSFVVQVMDGTGTFTNSFTITVASPAVTMHPTIDKTAKQLQIHVSVAGSTDCILESAQQISGPWSDVLTNVANGSNPFATVPTTNVQTFYRLRIK